MLPSVLFNGSLFACCESKEVSVLLIGMFVLYVVFHFKSGELLLCPLCGEVHIVHPP